jgi:hypothetical protein
MAVATRAYLEVALDGVAMTNALDATVDLDFDRGVSQASIEAATEPGWDHDMPVTISMGNGTNNIARFRGVLWEPSWQLSPGRWKFNARGQLSRLETSRQNIRPGQLPEDLTGDPTPTIGTLALAILNAAGLDAPSGNVSDDSSILLGSVDPHPLMWKHNFTARQHMDELQRVSVGRRWVESVGGELYFVQIIGRPRNVSDFTFTQGIDVFASTESTRTIRDAKNYIMISGYAPDAVDDHRVTVQDYAPNSFQPSNTYYPAEPVQSEWIQTEAHAQAMFDFWAQELSRELVKINYVTYRDDAIGPGQTHSLLFPNVHVTEPAWCNGVSISVRGGKFRQYIRGIAGGLPDDYTPPPII